MKKTFRVEVIEVENVPEGADAERVMENMIKQGASSSFLQVSDTWKPPCGWRKIPRGKIRSPGGYRLAPNLGT